MGAAQKDDLAATTVEHGRAEEEEMGPTPGSGVRCKQTCVEPNGGEISGTDAAESDKETSPIRNVH